jgi:hypothetical protein
VFENRPRHLDMREQLEEAVGFSKMLSQHCDELCDSGKGSITKAYHLRTGSREEPIDHKEAIESA